MRKQDPGVGARIVAAIVAALGRRSAHGWTSIGPDLQVPGLDRVFAVKDTATSTAPAGQAVPGQAPAAKQGGTYVARAIWTLLPWRPRAVGASATLETSSSGGNMRWQTWAS